MQPRNRLPRRRHWFTTSVIAIAAVLMALPAYQAGAAPPPWAPAHGYRAKHKNKHANRPREYIRAPVSSGSQLPDLLIDLSSCRGAMIGGVVGGVIGGVVGAELGKNGHRTAATIAGTLIGVVIGGSVGRSVDAADRRCAAHGLDRAKDHQKAIWNNPDGGGHWELTPQGSFTDSTGRLCRSYSGQVVQAGRRQDISGRACRQSDGSWEVS